MAAKLTASQLRNLGEDREALISDALGGFAERNRLRNDPNYPLVGTPAGETFRSRDVIAASTSAEEPATSESSAPASATPKRKLFGRK